MAAKTKNIMISACLLGCKCRYDGKDNLIKGVAELENNPNYKVISICPEQMGGLTTPRTPGEVYKDKVITSIGEDITHAFEKGAKKSLEIALSQNVQQAILKSKSPSCGYGEIYDGTFTRTMKKGNGFTAQLLAEHGIEILNENNYKQKLKKPGE